MTASPIGTATGPTSLRRTGSGKSPYGSDGKFRDIARWLIELARSLERTGATREEAGALNQWRIEEDLPGHDLMEHELSDYGGHLRIADYHIPIRD
jgi:hypothetical protein